MTVKNMKVTGSKTTKMVMAKKSGLMVLYTKANSFKGERKDMENSYGVKLVNIIVAK